jgi:hypothetical protein
MDFGHGGNVLKPVLDFITPLSNIGALPPALADSAAALAPADAISSATSAHEAVKKPA